MKILYIWDADYPWDVRVEKICNSLSENGYEVHIVARNLKKSQIYELLGKLHVHRMDPVTNDFMNYALSFPAFFSPYWKKLINRVIEEQGIHIIIVRDLPLAAAAIRAGKKYKIPVLFDMAEDYCAMIQEIWKQKKFNGFNLVVRNPYFAKILEKYVLERFDHIIVVVEEARELVHQKGVAIENITIIRNTPLTNVSNFDRVYDENHIDIIKNRYSIIYTGGITFDRGIDVVLDSLPRIKEKIKDILFVIVGNGNYASKILDIVEKRQLHPWVMLVGWVDHTYLYKYIKASKIGIIPHYVTDHISTTIPNKLFDYMACGIPVLASDAPPLRRIIIEEECGKTFISGSSSDLAEKVFHIYGTEERFGENGRRAFHEKYNWGNDEMRLIQVIKYFQDKV